MISVEEAKRIMMEHVPSLDPDIVTPGSAAGYVFKQVIADHDHPLFDMSAVDGYAFASDGSMTEWNVVGEVAAGEVMARMLRSGECARIFTGAMVPEGADTVVMQEFAVRSGNIMTHKDARLRPGGNVRKKGEHVRQGEVVLNAGHRLTSAAKGLLASVGVTGVHMVRAPQVLVINTGSEFTTGKELRPGLIFSSNDVILDDLLRQGGALAEIVQVPDDMDELEKCIRSGAVHSDLIISTGGASVGDHDLVEAAVRRCGGRIVFHGVAQKPGKPMLFALFGEKPFFGLPGNPRAVMVLFWEYVLPFLRAMQGAKDPWLVTDHLPAAHPLEVKGDRAEFRAAQVRGGKVSLLRDEGSHMLRSLIDADALAYAPADRRSWAEGDPIEVHYLPR